jgi:25S rRNA (uracil2634-N3)-methyltransferase
MPAEANSSNDAADLDRTGFRAFDVVAFNFPHLGGATKEALVANQALVSGFFAAAKSVLRPPEKAKKRSSNRSSKSGGQVFVTLRSTLFYDSWEIDRLASEQGLELVRKDKFEKEHFNGYTEVRTTPGVREASDTSSAFTHIYTLDRMI